MYMTSRDPAATEGAGDGYGSERRIDVPKPEVAAALQRGHLDGRR
jgi:hypothetical protein